MRRLFVWAALAVLLMSFTNWVKAQDSGNSGVSLTVQAGYETYFRDSEWLPVVIRLRNDGDAVSGRLVIRPETTNGILNTNSTPVSLPAGARQTITLYVTARGFANQVRVELLDGDKVIAQQNAPLRVVSIYDPIYIVITEAAAGSIDLSGAKTGTVYQANMQTSDLPDRLSALDAVDVIALSDVDTGALSSAQVNALAAWVASGGHLIVTGGVNWQATAVGVSDLLPLIPEDSRTVANLTPVASWLRTGDPLDSETILATGALQPDAKVLIALADGEEQLPVLVRRDYGDGAVTYLAVDPNTAPLRGWAHLNDLWTAILTTVNPLPGWGEGFAGWEQAAVAAEILPGFDPLPDVVPLFGFLALYIVLIGPINYFILARLNRREWAWVTIPVFILLFSTLAYNLGANLRGNEVTLSRLNVVRAWQNADQARVDTLLGLLSPKRAAYSFGVDESTLTEATFRPIPRPPTTGTLITRASQASVNVVQTGMFEAVDFNVDASFVAGFNAAGAIPKPSIGGSATIAYDSIAGQQIARGSVRNDTDMILTNPVILARGVSYHLENSLSPGNLVDFELTLPGEGMASAARHASTATSPFLSSRTLGIGTKQSVVDILGTEAYDPNIARRLLRDLDVDEQEARRRQWMLTGLINDYFDATGRGDRVYLAVWSDVSPVETRLTGANWNTDDRTLYLVELDSTVVESSGEIVVPAERFIWSPLESQMIGEVSPYSLTMQQGEIAGFRFTPLPDAVLSEVSQLIIEVDNINTGAASFPIQVWNWATETWDEVRVLSEVAMLFDPQDYLGPENTVQLRLVTDEISTFLRIGRISVSMVGMM